MNGTIVVEAGDQRPIWVIEREWYIRVATELEAIAKDGALRTKAGVFKVSERAQRRAAKQAAYYRKAAEMVTPNRQYEEVPWSKAA